MDDYNDASDVECPETEQFVLKTVKFFVRVRAFDIPYLMSLTYLPS